MVAQDALRGFARRSRLRVSSCNQIDPNVGERLTYQIRLWRRDRRIRILAAKTLLSVEIAIPDQQVVFAVNAPDRVLILHDRLATIHGMPVFGDGVLSTPAKEWLRVPNHTDTIEALHLSPRESLHLAQNQLCAVIEPNRDVESTLNMMLDIANTLPPTPSRPSKADAGELPPVLRPLVRYFAKLAIGDDELRSERLASLTSRQVATLLRDVTPLLTQIDAYLASFGDQPLTETAILMGQLAEAVAELRARDA